MILLNGRYLSWSLSIWRGSFLFAFIKGLKMNYFNTRYEALKAFPNSIVRKVLNYHVNQKAGFYVVFNDYTTYEQWRDCGHVK